MSIRVAIIRGTGYLDFFDKVEDSRKIGSPYGPSSLITIGKVGKKYVALLPRHGETYRFPPHKINYRANIWALNSLGVERIIAINRVGAVNDSIKTGDILIPHDIIDLTKNPDSTFHDNAPVTHVDVTQPYCPELRNSLIRATPKRTGKIWSKSVLACRDGPRFETRAEIKMLKILGCDSVGMTTAPEVFLARELKLCYASVCTVTNRASGLQTRVNTEEIIRMSNKRKKIITQLIKETLRRIPDKRNCECFTDSKETIIR
ncbi:MAG: S-methyl-5'-thioinosine phosphorylase [Candidatus Bathyarchaeota archaeon]